MHIPGMLGMPRRIYTYEADRGWAIWNMIVSSGAVFQAVATAHLCLQPGLVLLQRRGGRPRSVGRVDARVVDDLAAAEL